MGQTPPVDLQRRLAAERAVWRRISLSVDVQLRELTHQAQWKSFDSGLQPLDIGAIPPKLHRDDRSAASSLLDDVCRLVALHCVSTTLDTTRPHRVCQGFQVRLPAPYPPTTPPLNSSGIPHVATKIREVPQHPPGPSGRVRGRDGRAELFPVLKPTSSISSAIRFLTLLSQ
jgi:hypothetical protein